MKGKNLSFGVHLLRKGEQQGINRGSMELPEV